MLIITKFYSFQGKDKLNAIQPNIKWKYTLKCLNTVKGNTLLCCKAKAVGKNKLFSYWYYSVYLQLAGMSFNSTRKSSMTMANVSVTSSTEGQLDYIYQTPPHRARKSHQHCSSGFHSSDFSIQGVLWIKQCLIQLNKLGFQQGCPPWPSQST